MGSRGGTTGIGEIGTGVGGLTARRRMSAILAKALRMGGPKDRGVWMGDVGDVLCRRLYMSSAVC